MAARAYWQGQIRLALVSIPVQIFPATKSAARISFNQIHKPSGKRIRYEKVVPGMGAVEAEDIVKGYEVEKGKYVLLTDEEIDEVKLEAKRTIDLVQFVDAEEIDSLYFDKPYFVAPEDEEVAGEAYVVLRDALKETGKVGLGQVVVRGKSNIVALKASGKGLMIETLRYADEVQKADAFFTSVPEAKPDKELLGLAEELIKRKAKPFDPKAFKDPYEVALRELIDAKIEKRPPQEVEETRPSAKVINLMEALKKSVKGGAAAETAPAAKGKKAAAAEAATPTKKSAKGKAAKAAAKPAKGRRAA
jgi:DNA end-binding protein Ku